MAYSVRYCQAHGLLNCNLLCIVLLSCVFLCSSLLCSVPLSRGLLCSSLPCSNLP